MRTESWLTSALATGLVVGSLTLPASAGAFDEEKIKVEDLPRSVLKAAKQAFPEAKIVGASKETEDGETIYEVMLTEDGKSIDLAIDDEGEIEAVEREIEVEDLPKAVIRAAAKNFPTGKITKVEEVSDEDDVVVYELAIKVGAKEIEVVMAPNGKILEPDDEDEDDDKAKKKDKDDDKKEAKAKQKGKADDDEKKEKKPGKQEKQDG